MLVTEDSSSSRFRVLAIIVNKLMGAGAFLEFKFLYFEPSWDAQWFTFTMYSTNDINSTE